MSLYAKYFRTKEMAKTLQSDEYREENLESYSMRVINLLSEERDLDALNGLRDIVKVLDLNNVDYLVIKIVFTVLAWITYMTTFIRMRFYNLQTKFIVRYSFLSIIFIMIAFFVNI